MILERRGVLKLASTALAAPAVTGRTALGADPIKVVGIHDTSGGLDIYGQPMVACLDYAVAELNEAGGLLGRPIQLINYDPQSSIQLYTQFATQAATRDRAAVVHAGITSASREAIRPVLRRYSTQYEGGVCDRNSFCTGSTPAQTRSPASGSPNTPAKRRRRGARGRIVRELPAAGLDDPALEHEFIG